MDDLSAIAFVHFDISHGEFLLLTPITFDKLLIVRREVQIQDYRTKMNIMRQQTLPLINIHLSKKDKIKNLFAFMPFPWEESEKNDTKIIEMTEEDWVKLDDNYPANLKHK